MDIEIKLTELAPETWSTGLPIKYETFSYIYGSLHNLVFLIVELVSLYVKNYIESTSQNSDFRLSYLKNIWSSLKAHILWATNFVY